MEHYTAPGNSNQIIVNAFILLVAGVFCYYVWRYWIKPATIPSQGDDEGYEDTNLEVNNTPGTNPEAITDGVNNFADGNLHGYACMRCADNGAQDGTPAQGSMPPNPSVSYTCAPQETTSWGRGDSVVSAQSAAKVSVGNMITTATLGDSEDFESCKNFCEEINNGRYGDLGPCVGVTHNKSAHSCSFYWNCDKVKKSSGHNTFLPNFNINKQPEVIL